jgi:hypothetical protein
LLVLVAVDLLSFEGDVFSCVSALGFVHLVPNHWLRVLIAIIFQLRYSYCSNRQAIPTTGLGAISQHGLGI